MEGILPIDTALRGAAGGFALLLAAFALVPPRRGPAGLSLALLGLGLASYLLVSAPAFDAAPPAPLYAPVVIAMALPAILWWAGLEFFDEAAPFRAYVVPLGLIVVATALATFAWPPAGLVRGGLVVLLYLHLFYIAWKSGPGDLIEARRGLRRVFLGLGALLGIAITAEELGLLTGLLGPEKFVLQAASLAALLGAFLTWFAANRETMFRDAPARPRPLALTAAEHAVLDRLTAAMEAGVWAEEGLTIGQLAGALGTTEHRLRRVINQGLGYRNFARFLNERRIARAREILSEPARADTPILTLAYEVGFASLGPFNRAFRDITGLSPSEFRATAQPIPDKATPKPE
ncbi:hypothetical protein DEA8626_03828 [Defluviimonas aquaemixtae]|uniref:HTH araC/xylS-type domain-containing protein n=1 Tax=Albidovulum aquaemixtae TaxID=1542388 RepID=A0A2R8BN60_9RHOB|nr:AraC family transcriptional regulator [Defluviimonas aquaemixtae]SPH24791.1 hypothetical protein DEA8626_03828 [Defluviimonas aquaemixtae]